MEPRDEQKDEMETMLSREGHGDTPMASASLPSGTEGCLTLWVVGFNVPHKDVKSGGWGIAILKAWFLKVGGMGKFDGWYRVAMTQRDKDKGGGGGGREQMVTSKKRCYFTELLKEEFG